MFVYSRTRNQNLGHFLNNDFCKEACIFLRSYIYCLSFLCTDADIPSHPPRKGLARRHRLSNLQDGEEEEDVSSGDTILPPRNLELDRQFVEGTDYSAVIRWEPPQPLPPETSGYNIPAGGCRDRRQGPPPPPTPPAGGCREM